ncbi:MAG: hypothetical protein RL885_29605 [Planctomycetota bacterium]
MKAIHHPLWLAAVTCVLAIAVTGGTAQAQGCLGPDNLTGPCCSTTAATLPSFPGLSFSGDGICWASCGPCSNPVDIRYDVPSFVRCGVYKTDVFVFAPLTGSWLIGSAHMDYTRTWEETNDDGQTLQVFRFLVKVDMTASGTFVCPIASATEPTHFYHGFLDYAFNCSTGQWEPATALYHSCDVYGHNPVTSAVPGAHHPGLSTAIVGPITTANPFSYTIEVPFSGPVVGGAMRTQTPPSSLSCSTEEPIAAGGANLGYIGSACACPLSLTPPNIYSAQPFSGGSTCGSSFGSILTTLPLQWIHTISQSLGRWTGSGPGTPYPGNKKIWSNEAFYAYTEGCTSDLHVDMSYGVLTAEGFPVTPDLNRPWQSTSNTIDIASNFSKTTGIVPPFNGAVFETNHLIYANF